MACRLGWACDLSPHNVMVGFDGRVKVLDFGVAKVRDQRTVTLAGIVKGKPLYMSPEQATAERIDRRSDLFSMGLILYEALTGERAFDRNNDTLTMEAIVNDVLPRHAMIPVPLWHIVARALAKDPHNRYRTALEMAEALSEACPPLTVNSSATSFQLTSRIVVERSRPGNSPRASSLRPRPSTTEAFSNT